MRTKDGARICAFSGVSGEAGAEPSILTTEKGGRNGKGGYQTDDQPFLRRKNIVKGERRRKTSYITRIKGTSACHAWKAGQG